MRRTRLILLSATVLGAASVFPGLNASSASAAGPLWLGDGEGAAQSCPKVGPKHKYSSDILCLLLAEKEGEYESEPLRGVTVLPAQDHMVTTATKRNSSGDFKLATSVITIECTTLNSPTILMGGTPATTHSAFTFTGCSVKEHAKCTVNSPGEPNGTIATEARGELVYAKEEEDDELALILEPESGETFLTLDVGELEGSENCPLFTKGEDEVEGSVAAEISPVATMTKVSYLKFPSEAIAPVYRWVGEGKFSEVTPSLKAFGVLGAKLVGEAEVSLENNEEWGVLYK